MIRSILPSSGQRTLTLVIRRKSETIWAQHVTKAKLFVATNTLNTRKLLPIRDKLIAEGRENVKYRLGLKQKYYLSFIGRLQPRKKLPYLLDVYEILRTKYALDLGVLIIGKGDQELLKKQVASKGLEKVHLLGALSDEKAGEYIFASDVMVIPGWLGLVVNYAFLFGLPIVSQWFGENLCGHGPEASYVKHGQTGWFAEAGDKTGMAKGILHILENWQTYSDQVSAYVDRYLHIEHMLDGFTSAIAYAKKKVEEG